MARQILLVDAVATNRIVLKVKLAAAFYEVEQAVSAAEALEQVRRKTPSVILIGGLGDASPVDLCRRLRSLAATAHCPIVLMASENSADARIAALEAGASSILDQPCCDTLLLARLRALLRGHETEMELRMRDGTHRALGLSEPAARFDLPARIGIIAEERRGLAGRLRDLRGLLPHRLDLMSPREVFHPLNRPPGGPAGATPDVLVIALDAGKADAEMQILPDLRARAATRYAGVLVLAPENAGPLAAAVLDLGADDVAPADTSPAEIALRVERLVARKRMADRLRSTVREGLRAAVTDPLTGLFNRRYALPHITRISERATRLGRPFAVMVADLDHFKKVNDNFGHAAGDAVLSELARRLRDNLRAVDLVARIGGEEFLVVLPDAADHRANRTAHRLCAAVSDAPFAIPGQEAPIRITISIGVMIARPQATPGAAAGAAPLRPEALLRDADAALYKAKAHGRNQVELRRPAA
ncbi:MAG: diguanylate cyclase [Marinovum algicola]|uniref:diguanylate cyclase n=1 Tax=Marinovum algicola TaxID=42444 RepID=A0A975W6R0_9RHOB|nr:diguanylate cyclase [Marinovum algicola]SEI63574.1 two-component system, cell cycle response regulator [Marinovum algicola]SLN25154.1 Response regulator PleD [Marinovum algicola]